MNLKNIAIIAHVDHGKTTMVDVLLQQSGAFRENQAVQERAMDSNDLERERGITILAKCTSLEFNDTRINIVDTPGHADFGGEVERILGMVDGVIILVDAAEGPMPQTKFVLGKALKLGLRPIVIINKVDRPDERTEEVLDEIFDLFVAMDATDEQLDFPTLYASGKEGWAIRDLANDERKDMSCVFETILDHVPSPTVDKDAPFSFVATILESDPYIGRILTGRVASGKIKTGDQVKALDLDGNVVEKGRLNKILAFRHLSREPIEEAEAGDIISIAGLSDATVTNTICAPDVDAPLEAQPIDPPTLVMTFAVNDSPLAGREGDKVTSRMIRDRLWEEKERNIAIKVTESENKDAFEVAGRGELQLCVIIENMRREGFELSISRPRVLYQTIDGQKHEPFEEIVVDVDDEYSGTVVEKLSQRKCEMTDMRPSGGGKTRVTFMGPSRGLIGYHGDFLSDTRGTGIMNRVFHSYQPFKGDIPGRRTGVLISNGNGDAVGYALWNLEDRGVIMVEPGSKIYEGMIIGEHSRSNDLVVNALKAKQLTNIRASGRDEAVRLTPPKVLKLEEAVAYIADDELVEVTPENIRLRKHELDPVKRKRAGRE